MELKANLDTVYASSPEVVARKVKGEFIIIPVTSGVGDTTEEIFTLNETGKAIWDRLDGKRSLKDVVKDLDSNFEGTVKEIEKDVIGLTEELLKRRMLVEVKTG